ncbi:MAG: helix-turn-helix domain-containing protein [Ruminococcaceae bacterium]|nr:helix-turn-helix domain-containing protein [Oscillospiraceae bacterium]
MKVVDVKHAWTKDDLLIDRPSGFENMYIFLHFWDAMLVYSEGETVPTDANACIVYAPGEKQFATAKESWQHDWVIVTSDVKELIDKLDLKTGKVYYPKNYKLLTEIIRKIEKEYTSRDEYSDDICECLITELFTVLVRETSGNDFQAGLNRQTKEQLERLRKVLRVDYTKQWSIDDMAKYINISPSYLYAVYKKLYGVSPMQDLINIRMQQAKKMLSETQRSKREISEWLGYSYPSHFVRQFTRNVGVSPLKYRQNNGLEHRNDFTLPHGT